MEDNPTFDDALAIMRDLRARCEWDRAQTHDSLRPYLIEEAHELDDAIRAAAPAPMRDELGDLLLQVLFHSVIAEELGEFKALDVPKALIAKMKTRHPHLYGGGTREPWEKMKSKARASIAEGVHERGQNSGPRGAYRMAECDRATAHVHSLRIELGELAAGHGHAGKGLVNLPEVDLRRL